MNNIKPIIFIHEYYTGKFDSVKHTRVYDCILHASKQQKVLGGVIKVCEIAREYK